MYMYTVYRGKEGMFSKKKKELLSNYVISANSATLTFTVIVCGLLHTIIQYSSLHAPLDVIPLHRLLYRYVYHTYFENRTLFINLTVQIILQWYGILYEDELRERRTFITRETVNLTLSYRSAVWLDTHFCPRYMPKLVMMP